MFINVKEPKTHMENQTFEKSAKCNLKKILLSIVITLTFNHAIAQSIQWQKSLGGNGDDEAVSIQQTIEGGYIVAGYSDSNNGDVSGHHNNDNNFENFDYWIVKLDVDGIVQWQKSLGGTNEDVASSIIQTVDSGYIIAGSSSSKDGDVTSNHGDYSNDFWIVKLDIKGNLLWEKSLGGSGKEEATSIQQTTDKGYIVSGFSNSNDGDVTNIHSHLFDYWVVKLDSTGILQWQKALGGYNDDRAYYIEQTEEGGYIVAGYSSSKDGDVTTNHGSSDYWVVKLDSIGNLQWQKSLGGSGPERVTCIKQTNDSGYIIAGFSKSNDGDVVGNKGDYDYWLVKLDGKGVLQWQKSLGGTRTDRANSVQQTSDNGFICAGVSESNDGDITNKHEVSYDYWVIKIDSDGNLLWNKTLGGTGRDEANFIRQTSDNEYIIAGVSSSIDGDVTGNHSIPGFEGTPDYWIVKLDDKQTGTANIISQQDISIYPNPASSKLTVDFSCSEFSYKGTIISLLNINGEKVLEMKTDNFLHNLNLEGIPKGMYFIKIENNAKYLIEKLIVK